MMKKSLESTYMRRRIEAVGALFAIAFLVLCIRAVDLQVLQSDRLRERAKAQYNAEWIVEAPRGTILDAKGRILAESVEVPSIAAIAEMIPQNAVSRLAEALNIGKTQLIRKIHGKKGFVWLARQVSPETARRVMALNLPGVRVQKEWRRYYPFGPETGHVLGFVGIDGHGLEGLEHQFDALLTGKPGRLLVKRDARGRWIADGVWVQKPQPGRRIRLTIDATLQSIAYAALVEGVKNHRAKAGSVVIIRPDDGAILAMVNWPGFNPNNYQRHRPSDWRNRAVTDMIEPGSVIKPFTVAAALMTGKWRPNSILYCENGRMRVADYVIHDVHPEGWLDLTRVIARSSNIGAAKLALDIGPAPLHNLLANVGFGSRTGIPLPGESPGILLDTSRWGPVETSTIAFGQGIAATPLQLAASFSVFANGGVKIKPRLLLDQPPDQGTRVMPKEVAETVMRMLVAATSEEGTGSLAVPPGFTVAGKTGTAQKPSRQGGYAKDRFRALFVGAVPADHPCMVIAVVVDEPQDTFYGGQVAAPIFRKIASEALPYLGLTPTFKSKQQPWTPVALEKEGHQTDVAKNVVPPLYGKSLRQVRKIAMNRSLKLIVHGSGWVAKQKPDPLTPLKAGDTLEVWLHD